MRTYYFSLDGTDLQVIETTPGNIKGDSAWLVAWALQYIYNLSH